MRLEQIADALWLANGPTVDFFGFPCSTRMLVARLPTGLWIWSPTALDAELRQEVDALGPSRGWSHPTRSTTCSSAIGSGPTPRPCCPG